MNSERELIIALEKNTVAIAKMVSAYEYMSGVAADRYRALGCQPGKYVEGEWPDGKYEKDAEYESAGSAAFILINTVQKKLIPERREIAEKIRRMRKVKA